jgi:hypothetical protein
MELRKILSNLKGFVEIKPIIIGGAVLALLAADMVFNYSRNRESIPTAPHQTRGIQSYRGTSDGDNLCEGTPDRIVLEMIRNSPTLSPDRIADFCSWYKREHGTWQKWDEDVSRTYTSQGLRKFLETK